MKKVAYIKMSMLIPFMVLFATIYIACKKDETRSGSSKVAVDRVSVHNTTTTDSSITQARRGDILRLDGSGFSSAKGFYINGVKVNVNPVYVTDNHIVFQIPSNLPFGRDIQDSTIRNTIRIVTKNDDFTYKFIIQGASPVITSVSHTLPKEGEIIQIIGQNLRDLTRLTFPGNISLMADKFTVNQDYTVITCEVPAGATTTPGAIKVQGDNGAANSYNYMNRESGIFIENFTNDPVAPGETPCNSRPYNYGTNISGTLTAQHPTSGSGPKNPQYYRQVPTTPKEVTAEDNVGGFDFFSCSGLITALSKSEGVFTATTSVNNLAIQYDVYIPVSWTSGFIRLDMSNGNTQFRHDYAPWARGAGDVTPVQMDGWTTVTIPLSALTGLNGGKTYQDFINLVSGKGGSIRFINGTYRDSGGTGYAPRPISGFQYSLGNFRIVPYTKPAV